MRRLTIVLAVIAPCANPLGCRAPDPGPDLQVVPDATIVRRGDAYPARSPIFDGATVQLAGARGETLGVLVYHRAPGPVALSLATRAFDVDAAHVTRPSTEL